MAPLISMTVTLMVFLMLMTCLMMRPSASRTILLTTPLLDNRSKDNENEKKNHSRQANPFYAWMVQPLAETGIKQGQFFLARSSQKFSFDREKLTKSLRSFDTDSGVNSLSSMYKDGVDEDYGGGEEMGNTLNEILIN